MSSQKRSNTPTASVMSDSSPEKSPSRSWRGSSGRSSDPPASSTEQAKSSGRRRRRSQAPSRARRSRDTSQPGESSVWDASTWERPSPSQGNDGRSPQPSSGRGRSRTPRDRSPLRTITRTVVFHDRDRAPSPQPPGRHVDSGATPVVHVRGSSESTLTANSPAAEDQTSPIVVGSPGDRPPPRPSRSPVPPPAPERPAAPQPRDRPTVQPLPRARPAPRDSLVQVAPPGTPPPPGARGLPVTSHSGRILFAGGRTGPGRDPSTPAPSLASSITS